MAQSLGRRGSLGAAGASLGLARWEGAQQRQPHPPAPGLQAVWSHSGFGKRKFQQSDHCCRGILLLTGAVLLWLQPQPWHTAAGSQGGPWPWLGTRRHPRQRKTLEGKAEPAAMPSGGLGGLSLPEKGERREQRGIVPTSSCSFPR